MRRETNSAKSQWKREGKMNVRTSLLSCALVTWEAVTGAVSVLLLNSCVPSTEHRLTEVPAVAAMPVEPTSDMLNRNSLVIHRRSREELEAQVVIPAKADVLMNRNDFERTGVQPNERVLSPDNVKPTMFGKIYELPVDGHVYAQPLFKEAVDYGTPGGRHNTLFVATMHNTVYAFNVDPVMNWQYNPDTLDPERVNNRTVWKRTLKPSVSLPDWRIGYGLAYDDIAQEIGIVSTPVIVDQAIYVVTFTGSWRLKYHLHKLDIRTGNDLASPIEIRTEDDAGPVFRKEDGSSAVPVDFVSHLQNQRAGLAASRDGEIIYLSFGSYNDTVSLWDGPYHGWLFAYSAKDLRPLYAFVTTPTGEKGGIWMSGTAPAIDEEGNVYVATGNGDYTGEQYLKGYNFGDSVLRLTETLKFDPTEVNNTPWFTSYDADILRDTDCDLGSSGVVLFKQTNLAFMAGKRAIAYTLNRDNLGGRSSMFPDHVFQEFPIARETNCQRKGDAETHHLHGSAVYWPVRADRAYVYLWPENDNLQGYIVDPMHGFLDPVTHLPGNREHTAKPFSVSNVDEPEHVPGGSIGMPGGILSVSANGTTESSGIVWALHPWRGNANTHVIPGVLRAFLATDLTKELWNSQASPYDNLGYLAKFAPPTIAGGSVFVPTFSKHIAVYGLFH